MKFIKFNIIFLKEIINIIQIGNLCAAFGQVSGQSVE